MDDDVGEKVHDPGEAAVLDELHVAGGIVGHQDERGPQEAVDEQPGGIVEGGIVEDVAVTTLVVPEKEGRRRAERWNAARRRSSEPAAS